jgi:DNA-binding transcriptional LysR family regulator
VDLKRLEVFCKVVEMKSFTRAAEAVTLSQPTVSENIRLLEESLGEKLLDRLGREVLPTGAGQILYRHARRILQLRDEAIQAIEQYRGNLSGVLRLGASTIPGAYILPERIVAFKENYPAIRAMVRISGTSRIVEDLLQGEIELGLIGARMKEHQLEFDELFSDELVLVVYPGHPWSWRKVIPPAELEGQPFILREEGSGTRLAAEQALKNFGVDPSCVSAVAEMGSTEAVRQGVKAGIGIAILSSLAVAEDIREGALHSIALKGLSIRRSFYLARRKGRQLSPLATAFMEHILRNGQVGERE